MRAFRADRKNVFMHTIRKRAVGAMFGGTLCVFCAAMWTRSEASRAQEKTAVAKKAETPNPSADAYRFNTLGVAYLNQQRPADAQGYFEKALAADSKFAV